MQKNSCHPNTFREIFFQYSEKIRRFLYYRMGDWAHCEDLTQEVFLRLWKNCAEVAPDQAGGFLHTVANHIFLDEVRHQQVKLKFIQHEQHAPSSHSPGADMVLEDREMHEKLETALAALPETQRVVFLLSRVEKLKYHEIATHLNISVKAVEKRMHLALIELKKLI
jgi:RNA polymerase sigma-70 factor (family 1)